MKGLTPTKQPTRTYVMTDRMIKNVPNYSNILTSTRNNVAIKNTNTFADTYLNSKEEYKIDLRIPSSIPITSHIILYSLYHQFTFNPFLTMRIKICEM